MLNSAVRLTRETSFGNRKSSNWGRHWSPKKWCCYKWSKQAHEYNVLRTYELLKQLPGAGQQVLLKLYNSLLEKGKIPQSWKHAIVLPVSKLCSGSTATINKLYRNCWLPGRASRTEKFPNRQREFLLALSALNRQSEVTVNRLMFERCRLNAHLHQIGKHHTGMWYMWCPRNSGTLYYTLQKRTCKSYKSNMQYMRHTAYAQQEKQRVSCPHWGG